MDSAKFQASIDSIRALDPSTIYRHHLPPARGLNRSMIEMPYQAPDSPSFVGPDQATVEAMLARFEPEGPYRPDTR